MRRIIYNKVYAILLVMTSLMVTTACSDMHDPELHPSGKLRVELEVEQEVQIENMWDIDWEADWIVNWDEELHGKIGYTDPETFHMDYFTAGTNQHVGQRDVLGNRVNLSLGYGTYDMLFYNNDYELIRIEEAPDWSTVTAYTENNPYATMPQSMIRNPMSIRQMPDQLFAILHEGVEISDRLEDYVWIPEENLWLMSIESILLPRVFIYLVQVEITNNKGRVTGCRSLTIEGLAESTELKSGLNSTQTISHQFATHTGRIDNDDGTKTEYFAGRLTTFGIPGYMPWREYTRMKGSETRGASLVSPTTPRNICHIELLYANGGVLSVPIDVTDQIWNQPVGGVIKIVLNLDDYQPPEQPSGGGIDIGVGGWDEDIHDITV